MSEDSAGGAFQDSASPELSFSEYFTAITEGCERLNDVTQGDLAKRVPSCPDWTVTDLLEHVNGVLEFWATQVTAHDATGPTEPEREATPSPDQLGDRIEERAAELVSALFDAGADGPCWNWSGFDMDAAWVARRMALEVAIHRYDGELAAGTPTPIETYLAVDGIAERIYVHLASDVPEEPEATLGGSICLVCTDADAAWVVEVGGGQLRAKNYQGPASAVLRGRASELFLFTWNRIGSERLEVTGDRAVVAAWASLPV
jgi:uncharacterized protein (TIGR03083 family)